MNKKYEMNAELSDKMSQTNKPKKKECNVLVELDSYKIFTSAQEADSQKRQINTFKKRNGSLNKRSYIPGVCGFLFISKDG
jgi:hypothetical protein